MSIPNSSIHPGTDTGDIEADVWEEVAKTTVYQAWSQVMAAVQAIGKGDTNTQQGYKFRGVDAVVNAVGPELRAANVVIAPINAEIVGDERYSTKSGSQMRGVTVKVTWIVYGPEGDSFIGESLGEAADAGDKAIPKAHSVAYRTFLLQSLCIPTGDPDPDSESNEREEQHSVKVQEKQADDEQINDATRKEVETYAHQSGLDFYDVAVEVLGREPLDPASITVGEAKRVCKAISDRKKAA